MFDLLVGNLLYEGSSGSNHLHVRDSAQYVGAGKPLHLCDLDQIMEVRCRARHDQPCLSAWPLTRRVVQFVDGQEKHLLLGRAHPQRWVCDVQSLLLWCLASLVPDRSFVLATTLLGVDDISFRVKIALLAVQCTATNMRDTKRATLLELFAAYALQSSRDGKPTPQSWIEDGSPGRFQSTLKPKVLVGARVGTMVKPFLRSTPGCPTSFQTAFTAVG